MTEPVADQVRPKSGIPRLSRLPVRSSISSIHQPETSTDGGLRVSKTEPEQILVQKSRSRPAPPKLRGPETKLFVKPLSAVAASRKPVLKGPFPTEAHGESYIELPQRHSSNQEAIKPSAGESKASLSDRAIQTLSHIPPSPSPRRRQSGFFPSDSPAIRPPSSLGRNRPVTSADFYPPLPTSRPTSPSKRSRPVRLPTFNATKTQTIAASSATKKPSQQKDVTMLQTSTNAALKPALKSSAALRETIANAKAARRAVPKYDGDDIAKPMEAGRTFDFPIIGLEGDFHINPLRKRITSAKNDGKLDISGMKLKFFPKEVLNMYDLDNTIEGPTWYESVDLIRLNAADNELGDLGWDCLDESSKDTNGGSPGGIFNGLQHLDLHGNRLRSLPMMLGNLHQLTVLNLSRNRLSDSVRDLFHIFPKLEALRELNLAENGYTGCLLSLSGYRNLEVLDVHCNAFDGIEADISTCTKLRKLDVSRNRITVIPELDLPNLTSLNLSSNHISPLDLMANLKTPQLAFLDISTCRVDRLLCLSGDFPNLKTLIAFDNCISALNVDNIRGLEILDLRGNDLRSLPPELSLLGLKKLLVSGNPMRAPRREILEGTTEGLMGWLKGRLPAGMVDAETF
ncbi:MAG: hypothetical protein Q9172_004245 [Xanthocarpia lactea]